MAAQDSDSGLSQIFEHQLSYGLGWVHPMGILVDRAAWAWHDNSPVTIAGLAAWGIEEKGVSFRPGCSDKERVQLLVQMSFDVVVDANTDAEGWHYGTVFTHLDSHRPGGRAAQRFGDAVRRRKWMPRGSIHKRMAQEDHAQQMVDGICCARKLAKFAFALLSSRKFWLSLPLDPSAFFLVGRAHRHQHAWLVDHAKERCVTLGTMPSMLHDHGTLLQDLVCGAIHSVSAYGYPMLAGHLDGALPFVRLHTRKLRRFNSVGGISEAENTHSVSELSGVPQEYIFDINWRNAPFRPCYYVAADIANQCIVISVRGSLEMGDLWSDLNGWSQKVTFFGVDGWVHEGMMASARCLHSCTKDTLCALSDEHQGWPVLVTGHSLGGGVASLLALLLRDGGGIPGLGDICCITLGSAAVMSESLASICEEFTVSLVLGEDLVPHVSIKSFETLFNELSRASLMLCLIRWLRTIVSRIFGMVSTALGRNRPGCSARQATPQMNERSNPHFERTMSTFWNNEAALNFNQSSITQHDIHEACQQSSTVVTKGRTGKPREKTHVGAKDPKIHLAACSSNVSVPTGIPSLWRGYNWDGEVHSGGTKEDLDDAPKIKYPAGKILWILPRDIGSRAVNEGGTNTAQISTVATFVDRTLFAHILLLPNMFRDHMPRACLEKLHDL